jgi:hypothetical protein
MFEQQAQKMETTILKNKIEALEDQILFREFSSVKETKRKLNRKLRSYVEAAGVVSYSYE